MPNTQYKTTQTVLANAKAAAKKRALLTASKSVWKKSDLSLRAVSL